MILFPAIDLRGGRVVRLTRGDYGCMTVYDESPLDAARDFRSAGAKHLHVVDLDGAKDGGTPNFDVIASLAATSGLALEVGGGIRSEAVIEKYLAAGVERVILGTAALNDPDFLKAALKKHGDRIAVGVDISEGRVATHGWTHVTEVDCFEFIHELEDAGVKTVICTDISKDGALMGTNLDLYRRLKSEFSLDVIASGGITSIDELKKLSDSGIYGAILGKALYAGRIKLADALEVCSKS